MQGSTMTMASKSETLVVNQFPQPVRPPNSVVGYPQQPIDDYSYMHVAPPTTAKQEEGEKKVALVDKLVNRILDKHHHQKLPDATSDVKSQGSNSRGLEQPVEGGAPEKLERFKIRTVVAGEVVTEDDDNKK